MRKAVLLLIIANIFIFNLRAQDTIVVDSTRLNRLITLMKEYNAHSVYIDTSEFVQGVPDEKNINLLYSASSGFCGKIISLLRDGANINYKNDEGATALHYSVASGFMNASEIILILGGDPDAKDMNGCTPLSIAVRNDNLDLAQLLIQYTAGTSVADSRGMVPLHLAVKNGSFYMTDMLLYYGADPDLTDKKGNTPLMYAVSDQDSEIADLLLQSGANPNIGDRDGLTPFMSAAQNGDTLLLKLLSNYGADIYAINAYGYDAFSIALKYNRTDAVRYLKTIGNLWFEKKKGKVDPEAVAIEQYGSLSVIGLDNRNLSLSQRLFVNSFSFSGGGMVTNHLAMLNGQLRFRAPVIKSGLFLEYTFSPSKSRVLVKSSDYYYQYFVSVAIAEAGIYHEWPISESINNGNFRFVASLSGAYKTYSQYSGTDKKAADKFCIIPSAGISYSRSYWGAGAELKYIDTPFYKMLPVWFGLKLTLNFTPSREAGLFSQKKEDNNE